MKTLIIAVCMFVIATTSSAFADSENNYKDDWASPQSLIDAMYETISAEPGETRNWDRFRELFFDEAAFLVAVKAATFEGILASDVDGLIQQTDSAYAKTGFHELELGRKVFTYGSLASVYSTYEIKLKKADEKPIMKGLNHFQLLNDGDRWWIISNTAIIDNEGFEASKAF